jgi:hypothetical protein
MDLPGCMSRDRELLHAYVTPRMQHRCLTDDTNDSQRQTLLDVIDCSVMIYLVTILISFLICSHKATATVTAM